MTHTDRRPGLGRQVSNRRQLFILIIMAFIVYFLIIIVIMRCTTVTLVTSRLRASFAHAAKWRSSSLTAHLGLQSPPLAGPSLSGAEQRGG